MRILLLCDDYYHPGKTVIDGIEPLKEQGFHFDVIIDARDFSLEMLDRYPVVFLCKMDEGSQTDRSPWKTHEVQEAFVNYVQNGNALVVVHSGIVPAKEEVMLENLIGCRFLGHPNQCPVTVQPVKPHPVTDGVGIFCETDEHYRIEITAADADILLASYSPPQGEESKYQDEPYHNTPAAIHAAGFVRIQGKGRICVLTPGHTPAVWQNPQFQKLLVNALKWAGGL